MSVINETATSITVQWGDVPCIDRNGNIIGYSVRYRVNGSSDPLQTTLINDPSTRQTEIPGLNSSTTYSIQIAATNSNGTGPYSDPVNQLTLGNCLIDY